MIKKLILCAIVAVVATACNNNENSQSDADTGSTTADTLSYSYDSVKVISKNKVANANDVTKATITYPVFETEKLNEFVKRQVFDFIGKDEQATSYTDIANSFINGYDDFYKQNKDSEQYWFLLIKINVVYQTNNYLALKYINADYSGGAHPNTVITYINYNPKTNQTITLDSLIAKEQQPKLLAIAEGIFRKDEKLSATAPLTDGYFFEDGKFALAQNFYVNKNGLVFVYNPYEIKPYAAGITTLTIPFTALKEIAKPNTILTSTN